MSKKRENLPATRRATALSRKKGTAVAKRGSTDLAAQKETPIAKRKSAAERAADRLREKNAEANRTQHDDHQTGTDLVKRQGKGAVGRPDKKQRKTARTGKSDHHRSGTDLVKRQGGRDLSPYDHGRGSSDYEDAHYPVAYEDKSIFTKGALRRMRLLETYFRLARNFVFLLIVLIVVFGVGSTLGMPWLSDYFGQDIAPYGAFGLMGLLILFIFASRDKGEDKSWLQSIFGFLGSIQIRCPTCSDQFNMIARWECGDCGHTNKRRSPMKGCSRSLCDQRAQSAVQCPKCGQHLVLSSRLYTDLQSNQSPHVGVARYEDDNKRGRPAVAITRESHPEHKAFRGV